jgi:magnesium transporter
MKEKDINLSYRKHPNLFFEHFIHASDEDKKKMIHHLQQADLPHMMILLDSQNKDFLYKSLSPLKQSFIIKHLASDELVYWIKESKYQQAIINQLDSQKKHHIEKMMMYHETLVGSMMQVDVVKIHINQTAGEVLKYIIHDVSEYYYMDILWVVDEKDHLVGKLSLSELLVARKNTKIDNIFHPITTYLHPSDDITLAIQKMMDYDKEAIAVIENQLLVGIITSDDVFDELIESYEVDYQKLANIKDFDEADTSLKRYQKRMPWLLIALIMNTSIALILSVFEPTLSQVTLLVLFQPLILGMAGNISTQALGVTLLSLDNEDFNMKVHRQKELRIGLMNAILMSALTWIFSTLFLLFIGETFDQGIRIGLQVSMSLLIGMTVAATIGLMMPVLLKKLNKDPAVASGPLITTLNDFIGLFIYFSIASLFLTIL